MADEVSGSTQSTAAHVKPPAAVALRYGLDPPFILGQYRIEAKIGQGGMVARYLSPSLANDVYPFPCEFSIDTETENHGEFSKVPTKINIS